MRDGPIDESWPIVFSAKSTSCPERKPLFYSEDWQVDSATMYDTDTYVAVSKKKKADLNGPPTLMASEPNYEAWMERTSALLV